MLMNESKTKVMVIGNKARALKSQIRTFYNLGVELEKGGRQKPKLTKSEKL